MKFILNEYNKFILEERFILKEEEILTEASVADVALKWTNTFKNTLVNTKAVLTKYNDFANISNFSKEVKAKFTKLQSEITTASGEIGISLLMPETELASNLLAVKAELESYIKALQLVIPEITDKKSKDTITLLKSKIDDLKKINAEETWKKPEIKELKEIMDWVEAKIYPLFDISSIEDTELKVEDFKKLCVDCLALIKNIEENLPEDFDNIDADDLKNYILIMKEASENTKLTDASKVNKGLVIANLDTYLKNITILKQNYEKIKASKMLEITQTKAKNKAEVAAAEAERLAKEKEEKVNPTVDWAELYTQCGKSPNRQKAIEAFWFGGLPLATEANPNKLPIAANEKIKKGYYVGEWGNQASLIKSFGSHFTDSLVEQGWTPILNPFINLLKYLFKLKDITITDASFAHIVEAVDNKLLSTKDLIGQGVLGRFNLIFNPELYRDSTNIIAYLSGQRKVLNNRDDKKIIPEGTDIRAVFINVAANEGNKSDIYNDSILKVVENHKFSYELTPLTTFRELIKTKLTPEDEEEITVTKATTAQVTDVIKSIDSSETAKKFLTYLVNTYRVINPTLLNNLNKKFNNKLLVNRDATTTTFKDDNSFDKLMNRATTKYSAEQLETLIAEVIETAGI